IEDDEKWLDIDYADFEEELAGKKGKGSQSAGSQSKGGKGFGDQAAQENLRKMVSRFEDFVDDDGAGAEGVGDSDDDAEGSSSSSSVSGEDKDGSFDEAEFERAMKEMMGMPADKVEESGLLAEARLLALDDEKEGQVPDEDEEMRKVMEVMKKELRGHGALDLDGEKVLKKGQAKQKGKSSEKSQAASKKVAFRPERPPGMVLGDLANDREGTNAATVDDDSDVGPGDGELSSDDEDYNDVDLGLAKNMLEAFKGQAGMAGPAGNLMKALGVNMPRDESGRMK
ncbi:hypothetical protein LTR53_004264, partial [Teratosphaeriaceae sp. CCFEE 6253]